MLFHQDLPFRYASSVLSAFSQNNTFLEVSDGMGGFRPPATVIVYTPNVLLVASLWNGQSPYVNQPCVQRTRHKNSGSAVCRSQTVCTKHRPATALYQHRICRQEYQNVKKNVYCDGVASKRSCVSYGCVCIFEQGW